MTAIAWRIGTKKIFQTLRAVIARTGARLGASCPFAVLINALHLTTTAVLAKALTRGASFIFSCIKFPFINAIITSAVASIHLGFTAPGFRCAGRTANIGAAAFTVATALSDY